MAGLRANMPRIEAQRRYGMAQAVQAALDPEAMLDLAAAAGVAPDKLARARVDLMHEKARDAARNRYGV